MNRISWENPVYKTILAASISAQTIEIINQLEPGAYK